LTAKDSRRPGKNRHPPSQEAAGVPVGKSASSSGAFSLSEIDALAAKSRALRARRRTAKRHEQGLPDVVAKRQSSVRAPDFKSLGWNPGKGSSKTEALALDLGTSMLCLTRFFKDHTKIENIIQPTALIVQDSHAFRSLQPFSIEFGPAALRAWPADRVLRGTHGELLIDSQIGLVHFPADHALAGIAAKARDQFKKTDKQLVLTLPTFLPQLRRKAIRDKAARFRKGAFKGVPGAIAAAYFYLVSGFSNQEGEMARWARLVLEDVFILILDWGASGLEFGLVSHTKSAKQLTLRLSHAGTWPSLGGHRLTLNIFVLLKELLIEELLIAGPSEALVRRHLFDPKAGGVPRPIDYEDAFSRLKKWGPVLSAEEKLEHKRLKNILFPTAWRFEANQEPRGYSPYRRMAILHFKALWLAAERIKRLILNKPNNHRARGFIPWQVHELDSPFLQSLDVSFIEVPVLPFLDDVQEELGNFLMHIDKRLRSKGVRGLVNMAFCGMQAGSDLLKNVADGLSARLAPYSKRPSELKSVINRGAALLHRDWKKVRFDASAEILPFSVHMADCLGNIPIFEAGPLDEMQVYQRRLRVEDGFPRFEFFVYESVDGSHHGSWGCIDFSKPFEFTRQDRTIAVDPKYGFGNAIPLFRELRGDSGRGLKRCFDRTMGWTDGRISFRDYADCDNEVARSLARFLESELSGRFHSKVFLLEREFAPPPKRFDDIYQRYYLSYSQELMVVREWWDPGPGSTLIRKKQLYTCHGSKEANTILGVKWGYA
jgi:hypothetical protein